MHRITGKFILQLMTAEQKEQCVAVCQELLHPANDDENLKKKNNVLGDETRIYGYDVETRRRSSRWILKFSPGPKKACEVYSNVKVMLIIFSA
jgi:hypothetical protein